MAVPIRPTLADGLAVGRDEVARSDRVLQRVALHLLRGLRVRGQLGKQRPRLHAPLDAAHARVRGQVVHALHEGQLPQGLLQPVERGELGRRPELGVAHVDEGAVVGAELARDAQVGLPVRVVVRDQAAEAGVHREPGQPARGDQAGDQQEQEARHPVRDAQVEEALQQVALRFAAGGVHRVFSAKNSAGT